MFLNDISRYIRRGFIIRHIYNTKPARLIALSLLFIFLLFSPHAFAADLLMISTQLYSTANRGNPNQAISGWNFGPSLWYYNGRTYILWMQRGDGGYGIENFVAYYDHATGQMSTSYSAGAYYPNATDVHGHGALIVTNSGYILAVHEKLNGGTTHDSPFLIKRSVYPENISSFEQIASIDGQLSYPHLFKVGNRIYLTGRGVGSGIDLFYSDDEGETWSSAKTIVNTGGWDYSMNVQSPLTDKISIVVNNNYNSVSRYIYYLESVDGQNFSNLAGNYSINYDGVKKSVVGVSLADELVKITINNHGFSTNESVVLNGVNTVGAPSGSINGNWTIQKIDNDWFYLLGATSTNYWSNYTSGGLGWKNNIEVDPKSVLGVSFDDGCGYIYINCPNHGFLTGDVVILDGISGIEPSLDGEWEVIDVINNDWFKLLDTGTCSGDYYGGYEGGGNAWLHSRPLAVTGVSLADKLVKVKIVNHGYLDNDSITLDNVNTVPASLDYTTWAIQKIDDNNFYLLGAHSSNHWSNYTSRGQGWMIPSKPSLDTYFKIRDSGSNSIDNAAQSASVSPSGRIYFLIAIIPKGSYPKTANYVLGYWDGENWIEKAVTPYYGITFESAADAAAYIGYEVFAYSDSVIDLYGTYFVNGKAELRRWRTTDAGDTWVLLDEITSGSDYNHYTTQRTANASVSLPMLLASTYRNDYPDSADIRIVEVEAIGFPNTPPLANAGSDQTVYAGPDCIAEVTLDASASYDEDDDELAFLWTWKIDDQTYEANGVSPTIELPLGQHTIQLIVSDEIDESQPDEVVITVLDNTPPEFTLSVTPRIFWPPNHQMIEVTPTWIVTDNCDQLPKVSLVDIICNEKIVEGNGITTGDIQIRDDGSIYLKAERSATGTGRIYTITYQAVDVSGNTATSSATVTVPHDQAGSK